MAQFITKPVYTPKSKLREGLYTGGKEFMYADTLEEYIGLYHKYPNNAIYSEATYYPRLSRPIIEYVEQSAVIPVLDEQGNDTGDMSLNNSMYYRITEKRFNNHYTPPYHYPEPSQEEYDVGYMDRYLTQRVNDISNITEITSDEFDRINDKNQPGIDKGLHNIVKIRWTIDGPVEDVRKANGRVIAHEEVNKNMLGLSEYLTDLDEFHRNKHKIPE